MPLHRDHKLGRLGTFQSLNHTIVRADGGNHELLSRATDRLMMARIDKGSLFFLNPRHYSGEASARRNGKGVGLLHLPPRCMVNLVFIHRLQPGQMLNEGTALPHV